MEWFVLLQFAEKVRSQAHEFTQAWIAKRLRNEFRKAATLPFLRTDIKLLALIDVEQERGSFGQIEFLVTALGRIEQATQCRAAVQQPLSPASLPFLPLRVGRIELPRPKERLNQCLDR